MTTTFCSAHGLRDCAMCGPAVAAVTSAPAPTAPLADEERKAAEGMRKALAYVRTFGLDEFCKQEVIATLEAWRVAEEAARTPSPAPAAPSTEPVACADCGHAWGVHYANGDMRCAQHDCACGGYSTAKPAPSREVPAWFVETYTKHYAQMAAEQAAARPVPSVEAPPARTIRQRIESTLDPEAMRRVRGIDGFKDMQVWALARLVFCVVDVLDERNAERAVSQ